jgi:hypothetical protein
MNLLSGRTRSIILSLFGLCLLSDELFRFHGFRRGQ